MKACSCDVKAALDIFWGQERPETKPLHSSVAMCEIVELGREAFDIKCHSCCSYLSRENSTQVTEKFGPRFFCTMHLNCENGT